MRKREFDAGDRAPSLCEGDRCPALPDGKLKHFSATCEPGQKVDGRFQYAKADESAIPVIVGDMATTVVPGQYSLVHLVYNTISNLLPG